MALLAGAFPMRSASLEKGLNKSLPKETGPGVAPNAPCPWVESKPFAARSCEAKRPVEDVAPAASHTLLPPKTNSRKAAIVVVQSLTLLSPFFFSREGCNMLYTQRQKAV